MKNIPHSPVNILNEARLARARSKKTGKLFRNLLLLVFGLVLAMEIARAQSTETIPYNNLNEAGVILDGYDPVAFFTDHRPMKGTAALAFKYQGATYYFSSPDHLAQFKNDPEKYKPQFGGWCAYAVSLGRVAPIDVNTFSISHGRLFLQHNQRAVNGWNADVEGNITKADRYWPQVAAGQGRQIVTDEEKGFLNNTDANGVILQGFDAVAYFTDGHAVQGLPQFEARYQGATYWFASEEHANMFKDDPSRYAPQFGGFCGYAMSLNKLRPIDPAIFQIVNGRLILQHTREAFELFNKDVAGNTSKADHNWPGQVKKHAGKKLKFDKPAK